MNPFFENLALVLAASAVMTMACGFYRCGYGGFIMFLGWVIFFFGLYGITA
jgi:hypothetical protein